jgi:hypothetical protein
MILEQVQKAIAQSHYRITDHGAEEMIADDLLEVELIAATQAGEVIEDYPGAFPYPACLVLGETAPSSPLHLVWAFDATRDYAVLVTVYRPDPARWSADYRKRVKP